MRNKLECGRQLDYVTASTLASNISKICDDAAFTAPEDLEAHQHKLIRICGAMDGIAKALLLNKVEGK